MSFEQATEITVAAKVFREDCNSFFHDKKFDWNLLRRKAWTGLMLGMTTGVSHRALCWRVFLGVLPYNQSVSEWKSILHSQIASFKQLKDSNVLKMDKVTIDPLTALSSTHDNEEWGTFFQDVELTNFIKGDLDRLYMTGIADEYFQQKRRRDILLTVLFVWSMCHKDISYRQGMHEIAGVMLHVVECEKSAWVEYAKAQNITTEENAEIKTDEKQSSTPTHSTVDTTISDTLCDCFSDDTVEAHLYWLFDRMMTELSVLYDPETTNGRGGAASPAIVHFCTRVQEHFLSQLDPDLCEHMEQNNIPAQLYGMRWCRLLFIREFPVTHTHCLRIWDYIFACCLEQHLKPEDVASSIGKEEDAETIAMVLKSRYHPYTPLLAAIGDFMISLLLQIRTELLEGDMNAMMTLLMRYPQLPDITHVLDIADMVRRGVLIEKAHVFMSDEPTLEQQPQSPSWLVKGLSSISVDRVKEQLKGVGKRGSKLFQQQILTPVQQNSESVDDKISSSLDDTASVSSNSNSIGGVDTPSQADSQVSQSRLIFDDPLRFANHVFGQLMTSRPANIAGTAGSNSVATASPSSSASTTSAAPTGSSITSSTIMTSASRFSLFSSSNPSTNPISNTPAQSSVNSSRVRLHLITLADAMRSHMQPDTSTLAEVAPERPAAAADPSSVAEWTTRIRRLSAVLNGDESLEQYERDHPFARSSPSQSSFEEQEESAEDSDNSRGSTLHTLATFAADPLLMG